MRRNRRADESAPLLPPDDSDVEGFGDSGGQFFTDAWHAREESAAVEAFASQTDEDRDREAALARALSRRPTGLFVLLGSIVIVGAVLGVAVRVGWFQDEAARPDGVTFEGVLQRPGQIRRYEGRGFEQSDVSTVLVERFGRRDPDGAMSTLSDAEPGTDLPTGVVASPVIWGDRLHVVVIGPEGYLTDGCAVVALAASDLQTLDVAAGGARCGERFVATGDRVACDDGDVVLLEVWPPSALDPTTASGVPDQPVAQIRVRYERYDVAGWSELSIRGTIDLRSIDLEALPNMGGMPGTIGRFTLGGRRASCELIDRAGVQVRTL